MTESCDEAFYWYKKAAEQGLDIAQYNLAMCYAYGDGVAKDDRLAVEWLQKSAKQGNVKSFTYNDITDCFSICMKTAIVSREGEVSFLNDYNFSTGIKDLTQELHKATEYHLNNLKATVENKLKAFLPKE